MRPNYLASAIFILALLALTIVTALTVRLPYGSPGTLDFIQYWSAWQLLQQDLNPYDGSTMHTLQVALGQQTDKTIMMWNPPWAVIILAPVLSLPFENSATLWLLIQVWCLSGIAILAPRALGCRPPSLLTSAVATIVFYPIVDCLSFGQLGIALTFALVLFLLFQRAGRFFLAGLSLIPLTLKPHLFFLFAVPAVLWLYQMPTAHRRRFLLAFVGGFFIVSASTAVLFPQSYEWWWVAVGGRPSAPGAVSMQDWQTTTLATAVRSMLLTLTGTLPLWPLWTIPALAFSGTILFFSLTKTKPVWEKITPALLCLSLTTTWYGWLHDQPLLVLCQIVIVCDALTNPKRATTRSLLLILCGIQLAAIVTPFQSQHHYVWLPLALLVALRIHAALSRSSTSPSPL